MTVPRVKAAVMHWLVNGSATGGISPDDRGFSYGDGLFETIAVRGGEPRLFAAHCERLLASAARLSLPRPDIPAIDAHARSLIGTGKPDGTLKVIYTRGPGARGYAPPAEPGAARPTLAVGFAEGVREPVSASGVAVRTCRTPLSSNPMLAGMKTLNRLEQVLARSEWHDSACAEGLMFDGAGQLVCGTMSNVFIVQSGQVLTPLLDQCGVRGVMRQQVLAASVRLGRGATEGRISRVVLEQAEEVFVTNSQIGIWPVASVDGREYGDHRLTQSLRQELARAGIVERCA